MSVKRFDSGRLGKAKITSQGYLKARAIATRTGVFTYQFSDGSIRRELRLPEEVFHADALETLQNIPITLRHPNEMLTCENTDKYQKGFTGDHVEKIDDRLVECLATITAKDAIDAVMTKGMDHLSLGYHCDLEMKAGTWNGEAYDAIQRKIRNNHLAIVEKGRAGPEAKLRLDATDAVMSDDEPNRKEEGHTMRIKLKNGTEVDVADTVGPMIAQQLNQDSAEVESLKGQLKAATSEKESLQGKYDQAKSDVEKKEKELKEHKDKAPDQAALRKMFKARLDLEEIAEKACDESDLKKLDSMSDIDLKRAVIAAKYPELKLDGKTDEYIAARFDAVVETLDDEEDGDGDSGARKDEDEDEDEDDDRMSRAIAKAKRIDRNSERSTSRRGSGSEHMDEDKARDKQRDTALERWKRPLSYSRRQADRAN